MIYANKDFFHQIHVPFPEPTCLPLIRPSALKLFSLYNIFVRETFFSFSFIFFVSKGSFEDSISLRISLLSLSSKISTFNKILFFINKSIGRCTDSISLNTCNAIISINEYTDECMGD